MIPILELFDLIIWLLQFTTISATRGFRSKNLKSDSVAGRVELSLASLREIGIQPESFDIY